MPDTDNSKRLINVENLVKYYPIRGGIFVYRVVFGNAGMIT